MKIGTPSWWSPPQPPAGSKVPRPATTAPVSITSSITAPLTPDGRPGTPPCPVGAPATSLVGGSSSRALTQATNKHAEIDNQRDAIQRQASPSPSSLVPCSDLPAERLSYLPPMPAFFLLSSQPGS